MKAVKSPGKGKKRKSAKARLLKAIAKYIARVS
jgi:hypothetical protein